LGLRTSKGAIRGCKRELLDAYFARRDELGLSLSTEGLLITTATIHIADVSRDLGDDAYELEVIVKDAETFKRFF
jgi:hypothetical protein